MSERSFWTHMEFQSLEVEVEVYYDYNPKERETLTYPGCDAEVVISTVELDGQEITPTDLQFATLEQECWDEIKG